jgi:hypothetical protein
MLKMLRADAGLSDHEPHQCPSRETVPEVMKFQRRVVRNSSHRLVDDRNQPTSGNLLPMASRDRQQGGRTDVFLVLFGLALRYKVEKESALLLRYQEER